MHVNVYVLTSLASWSHTNHSLRGVNIKESDFLYLSELVHLDVIRVVKLAGVGREISELKTSIGDDRRRSSTTLHSYFFLKRLMILLIVQQSRWAYSGYLSISS